MRFLKRHEKYKPEKIYWSASVIRNGQTERDIFYLIYPFGAGFNLFKKVGFSHKAIKVCYVKRFKSAKVIANLMENG